MYNVFAFFLKNHESGEKKFFKRKCSGKEGNLNFGYDDDNYYFFDIQNDYFNESKKSLIDFINDYCKKIRNLLDRKVNYNDQFIIAVHPPGSLETMDLLKWQRKIHELNNSSTDIIVYYSSKDGENVYLKNHSEFDYNYKFLFNPIEKKMEEREREKKNFKKLLELLNARAEGKEIEFFDLKKIIDDLYHVFSLKALVCKGLMECIEKENYGEVRSYYLESLGDKDFKKVLEDMKTCVEVTNLNTVKDSHKGFYNDINSKLELLNPDDYKELPFYNQLDRYLKWYKKEFFEALIEKRKEVGKGD